MLDLLFFIHWNPNPEAFHIGVLSIKKYGLLWGAALLYCYFIEQYLFQKRNKDDEKVTLAIQYVFVGGLIGARLVHVLFYDFAYYSTSPIKIFYVWQGGLASHGGLLGGVIALYIFSLRNKEYGLLWLVDMGSIAVPVMAALIRYGNLLNSELYGIATNVPWGFVFEQVDKQPRHPVVLYEAIGYLILQLIMFLLFSKYKNRKPGIYIATLLVGLFGTRFLLEFLKVPDGAMIGFISKTQLLNIPFIIVGVILAYYSYMGKLKYSIFKEV